MPKIAQDRKSPEEWLLSAQTDQSEPGRLKLFLGYAPGVGKTYSMLSEGIRRSQRGEDVVIAVVETHGRSATADLASKLEQIKRREIVYKGTLFAEMDVDAVIARAPKVALVDELAHTNVEGSRLRKRYDDVLLLLENRIDVLSTLNIQHVESLSPRVQSLTGIEVREQVPDWVLDRADEIVMSDLTPEALVTRIRRGDVYPQERIERSLANFFRRGNLIALREMALQKLTRAVDRNLGDYVRRKRLGSHWNVAEKVVVCVSANTKARDLIARGAHLAEALSAELFILHVKQEESEEERKALDSCYRFARDLGGEIVELNGRDSARVSGAYMRENRITQAIVGRSAVHGWRSYLYFHALQKLMAEAPNVDLHIVTQEQP